MRDAMPNDQKLTGHGDALKLHRSELFGEVSYASSPTKTRMETPICANGTAVAMNYLILGVPANLTPKLSGRGGARNKADRVSHALSGAHVQNLIEATRHAETIGLAFTRMITIHWEAAGVPLERMANATGRFVDLLSKAMNRNERRTAWLWVHENGDNKGGHCHLLVHIPADLVPKLTRLQKRWLRRISGKPYRARVIHSRPIGGRLGVEIGNPALHAINLQNALYYVLKGADEQVAADLNIHRLEHGGRIIGKRCGVSQNIGAKARKDHSA